MALVEVRNLSVEFQTARGPFRAVDGVDFTVEDGEVLGVVGESGSGKSVSMLALMGLIGAPGVVRGDAVRFDGQALLGLSRGARRRSASCMKPTQRWSRASRSSAHSRRTRIPRSSIPSH